MQCCEHEAGEQDGGILQGTGGGEARLSGSLGWAALAVTATGSKIQVNELSEREAMGQQPV